jgi:hypothetical protein
MAKVVDITEKLSFDENPVLKIKDIEVEVNADAKTMLGIMGEFKTKSEVEASLSSVEKLFSKDARKKLDGLKLSFKDYMAVISAAMNLIQGDSQGE